MMWSALNAHTIKCHRNTVIVYGERATMAFITLMRAVCALRHHFDVHVPSSESSTETSGCTRASSSSKHVSDHSAPLTTLPAAHIFKTALLKNQGCSGSEHTASVIARRRGHRCNTRRATRRTLSLPAQLSYTSAITTPMIVHITSSPGSPLRWGGRGGPALSIKQPKSPYMSKRTEKLCLFPDKAKMHTKDAMNGVRKKICKHHPGGTK
mmetsp:Transcript_76546/g.234322  ORF Transcript_76546/g.234322 Transcript_76546/m.234322 type:complete len:210 (+) Transcript_76546:447-1076(+)